MSLLNRVEHVFKVFGDDGEASLQIGEDSEYEGWIKIQTTDAYSRDYYGNICLPLTPELAKLLGETLIKAADEVLKSKANKR